MRVDSKKKKKKSQYKENLYFNIQLVFAIIVISVSFLLKNSDEKTFIFSKESYQEFFETDSFMENTFSYNAFIEKMYNELQIRYGQLVTVFNSWNGKGSADIYPANASSEKYHIEEKGILPVKGYISSSYGIRTDPFDSKKKEFHTGIDIATAKGTYIRSAFSGTVIKAGYSDTAGNYIRISSAGGIETLYAHNQFNLVKEGDKILAGQVIATIGATGRATGPHLHFEFLADGIRYNPAYILQI